MNKWRQLFPVLLLIIATACSGSATKGNKKEELKVLQINAWQETTIVPEGFRGLMDLIIQTDPDLVFLCEVRNYEGEPFINKLSEALKMEEEEYYGVNLGHSAAILSRYPFTQTSIPFTLENKSCPITKASVEVNGKTVVCYSAHLDYTHYECYMPRGYSGTSWKKIEAPITVPGTVLEANRLSYRDEAIAAFIADAAEEVKKGHFILLGGDFNEPSHLDWQADTKDLWDHNGVVINWDCSMMLQQAGYKDSFREIYPDPVTHPGFTFPSANPTVPIDKLAWAPEADERDRIDFIYYYPHSGFKLESISVVGPSQTIIRGKEAENDASDTFIMPDGIWPTDHKGMFAVFGLN